MELPRIEKLSDKYFFFTDVHEESVEPLVRWLHEASEKFDELTIHINSPGGDVASAMAVVNAMESVPARITTVSTGLIASAATFISIAGDVRKIFEDTSVMVHTFSGFSVGKYHDLKEQAKEQETLHKRLVKHYSKHTGLSKADVETRLLKFTDTWLTADEAIEIGLADELVEIKENTFKDKQAFRDLLAKERILNEMLAGDPIKMSKVVDLLVAGGLDKTDGLETRDPNLGKVSVVNEDNEQEWVNPDDIVPQSLKKDRKRKK